MNEWWKQLYGESEGKDGKGPVSYTHLDVYKRHDHLRVVESLKHQRHLFQYKMPQAILEYIDPKWVVRYKVITNTRRCV